MKKFDLSYAKFLLNNNDYHTLLRYSENALNNGFYEAQAYVDLCNDHINTSKDMWENNEILSPDSENGTIEEYTAPINRYTIKHYDGHEEEISFDLFLKLVKRKAEENNPSAQYLLSEFYLEGNGVRKNINKAFELMKKSADNGYSQAQLKIAGTYLWGYFYNKKCDYEKGVFYLKKAAEQKYPRALRMLGYYHIDGLHSIKRCKKKAFELMSEAAEYGDNKAIFFLSDFYYYGIGTSKSIRKAVELCKTAADKGVDDAQYSMWLYVLDGKAKISYEKAYNYLKSAADSGLADACNQIGELYYEDCEYDNAFRYFNTAAKNESVEGKYNLADCYYYGKGTSQNYEKAFDLYIEAAESKHIQATYSLAWCYDYGQGTKKSDKLAFKWYMEAAKLGHPLAINNLGVCYATGKGTKKSIKKAIACYTVAAKHNVKESINSLGSFYETGNALEKDIAKAVEMYQKACSLGDCTAKFNLARCYEFGMGVEKDISKAVDLYIEATIENDRKYLDKLYKFRINRLSSEDAAKISKRLFKTNSSQYNERAMELLIYSADKGNVDSQRELGVRLWNDKQMHSLAVIYFSMAATKNEPYSVYNLANLYNNGYGVTQYYQKAFELYQKAAELGLPQALFELGNAYEKGYHGIVEANIVKAIEYYKEGAQAGNCDCLNSLGAMYMYGKGVRRNRKRGFSLFSQAAKANLEAKYNIALCYEHGTGTEKSTAKALEIYNNLASSGDSYAVEKMEKAVDKIIDPEYYFTLALCYDFGKGVECNGEKAIKYYTFAAEMGHDRAKHNLAYLYRYGKHDIEINYEKAIKYYSDAADNGIVRSINSLGSLYEEMGEFRKAYEQYILSSSLDNNIGIYSLANCYKEGIGTEVDLKNAAELLNILVERNHTDAMNTLAIIYCNENKNDPKAFRLFEQAAIAGNKEAMYNLALCYEEGKHGQNTDFSLAIEWYYEAAEKGYEPAIEKLKDFDLLSKADAGYIRKIAFDYYNDKEQQQKLYKIAAEGGDALAMHNVAYELEKTDPQKAFELYKKAADLNEPYGIYAVAKCYEGGLGVEKDDKLYFKHLKKVEYSGIPEAVTDLGSCYGRGIGTTKNSKKALQLYLRSAILGDSLAITNIAWFYETGTDVEKDIDLAYHLYKSAADNGEKHAIERLEDWE